MLVNIQLLVQGGHFIIEPKSSTMVAITLWSCSNENCSTSRCGGVGLEVEGFLRSVEIANMKVAMKFVVLAIKYACGIHACM